MRRYSSFLFLLAALALPACSSDGGEESTPSTRTAPSTAPTRKSEPPPVKDSEVDSERVRDLSEQVLSESDKTPAATNSRQVPGAGISVQDISSVENLLTAVLNDVNQYWAGVFSRAGRSWTPPRYTWLRRGESVQTRCGPTGPTTAMWCASPVGQVDNIYISLPYMFQQIYQRFGDNADFALAYVVAHEMGHHVQGQSGTILGDGSKCCGLLTIHTELQADCLAGVWANSAYYNGYLEAGDPEEAIRIAAALADRTGTSYTDPNAHGDATYRAAWFKFGYDNGDGSRCRTWQ